MTLNRKSVCDRRSKNPMIKSGRGDGDMDNDTRGRPETYEGAPSI